MTDKERAVMVDLVAMLDHYAHGRPDNWDGSTKGQALATLREARALLTAPDTPRT